MLDPIRRALARLKGVPEDQVTQQDIDQALAEVPPEMPAQDPGGRDQWCEMCGRKLGDGELLYIDPIPLNAIPGAATPDAPPIERNVCGKCFAQRYSERYPGVTAEGVQPD